jgi:hypothetical protein
MSSGTRISDAANNFEPTTMIMLNELHVNAGSSRRQHYDGKQRRIADEHNTGTVCRYILTDILRYTVDYYRHFKTL